MVKLALVSIQPDEPIVVVQKYRSVYLINPESTEPFVSQIINILKISAMSFLRYHQALIRKPRLLV